MSKKHKNVIWIFGDQHRAQALSCNGDPNVSTPEIDRMAADGVNFERAVCGFPLCCPFRGSLITSQYPHNCVPGHEYPLPRGTKTIAHAFGDSGYETAWFGKWHLGGFQEREGRAAMYTVPPEDRGGFDLWLGYENNNSQWDSWVHGHDRDGKEIEHRRLDVYETDGLTDILIDYIDEQGKAREAGDAKPFFATLSVQPPHDPYVAPPEYMERHNPRQIEMRANVPEIKRIQDIARRDLAGAYGMIENLDWNVGRIRQALEDVGLAEDTYLIFFSDHGDMHGSHGQFRKTSPWEESIRIPFIMAPGRNTYAFPRGFYDDVVLNHVDIAPTTLGLCGIGKPDWMVGFDYSAWGLDPGDTPEAPDSAYIQNVIPTGHGNSNDRPWRGVVTRDGWKYVCLEGQPWLLFNLNEDPYEQANHAFNRRFLAQRERLHKLLTKWIKDTGDTFTLPELVWTDRQTAGVSAQQS
jgi:arylsulfatase A-like enzyme